MKKVDIVREAVRRKGTEWNRAALRREIPMTQMTDAELDRAIQTIRKDHKKNPSTISTTISNNGGKGRFLIPMDLRDLALELYGEVWGRVCCYILAAHAFKFEDDFKVLLSYEVLASCHAYGYGALMSGKTPNRHLASEVWKQYKEGQVPFHLIAEDFVPSIGGKGSCRAVEDFEFKAEILDLLSSDSELVDVFTGLPSPYIHSTRPSMIPEIEEFRGSLNAQELDYSGFLDSPQRLFQFVRSNYGQNVYIHQSAILRSILRQAKPVYSGVERTTRLYTLGPSFQNLKRELRTMIFAGESQFDLAHAQLSILQELWDIPLLDDYLEGEFWSRLKVETGIQQKEVLKELVYRIAYGSKFGQCKYGLMTEAGLSSDGASKAMRAPIVKALFDAQDRQFDKVRKSKSVIDAFGRELIKDAKTPGSAIRSALAAQAQSYELKLMLPVINFLKARDIPIYLWLHDGFIVPEKTAEHFPTLSALVEAEAASLGMKIRLEHEFVGGK